MKTIRISSQRIKDWDTVHEVFAEAFGFPSFYGRNMDAWIDCMRDISTSKHKGMTELVIEPNEKIVIDIPEAESLRKRCTEVFDHSIDCTGFVNFRHLGKGKATFLLLFLH